MAVCCHLSCLLNKLVQELRLIISKKSGDEDWNLDAIVEEIRQELEARERAATSPTNPMKKLSRDQNTAAALLSGSSNARPTCCFCQQAHNSCRALTDIEARKTTLRKSGQCFVCLRKGHISRNCRSNIKCSGCQGRHHLSICSKNQSGSRTCPSPQRERSENKTPTGHKSGLNLDAPTYSSSMTTLWINTNRTV